MTPTATIASPQRRNVTVLALAQALFMSVQGMGAIANPAGRLHAARGRREVAGDGAGVPHASRHHGRHRSSLAADGRDRPPRRLHIRRAARSHWPVRRDAWPSTGRASRCCAPRRCARACRRHSSGISAWPRPTPPIPPAAPRRSRWSWRAACWRASLDRRPPSGRSIWLAPVTFAGVYLGMAAFSVAVLLLIQLLRIPGLSHGRARRRRAADDGDRAPAGLSRGARLLGVRLRGDDADHVGDAARHARLRLRLRRQRHRHPDAHHRHVPALVLHRPPDCALRRADGDRRRGADRARRRARQPGRPRAWATSPSPTS